VQQKRLFIPLVFFVLLTIFLFAVCAKNPETNKNALTSGTPQKGKEIKTEEKQPKE